ncbi:MAG: AtpZ/AtpI family protein [Alphaproteobacteria bacterium]|nr:AtpZ/AtpI family protein [Alphaproteobacteria bacterium]
MSDTDRPPSFDDLDARLKKARRHDQPSQSGAHVAAGLGWRLALELAAGMAVGGLIGWFLDRWLGTVPLFTIVFVFVGVASGVRNALRLTKPRDSGSR